MGTAEARAGRLVLALILGSAAVRVVLALWIGPSVDESYAVVMGRRLALSYYDHPPFLFWTPGLAARLAGSEDQLFVRLPFLLMFAGTTWLMYRLGAFLFGEGAGLWSAVLLNLTLFFTFSVAGWILPDGPLLLWSAAAALCLAHATSAQPPAVGASGPRAVRLWWLGFGLCCGLGLLSKYHAVFLLAGAGLFLVTSRAHRPWLRRPEPYASIGLAAVVFLPVVLWNAGHGWASLRFQGGRAVPSEAVEGTPFLGAIVGQAAWILPWIWVPLLVVLVGAARRGPRDARSWMLFCLGVGPIAFFTLVAAVGRRGLPHWQAPGYFMLLPLLGTAVADRLARGGRWTLRWLWACVVGLAAVLALVVTQVSSGWLDRVAPALLFAGDPTDDLIQWRPLVPRLREWGYPQRGVVVAGAIWADAAKLAYALGPRVPVCSVGHDPRGFEFVRSQESVVGRDVLLVARRRPGPEPMVAYAPYFESIRPLGTVSLPRGHGAGIAVSVYVGHRLLRAVPDDRTR